MTFSWNLLNSMVCVSVGVYVGVNIGVSVATTCVLLVHTTYNYKVVHTY